MILHVVVAISSGQENKYGAQIMKHAYLIIAHNEYPVVKRLIEALDDRRNDIFVHWDSKVSDPPVFHTTDAGLYLTARRVDVHWGDYSVVEAEYALFETSVKIGKYEYYHLLSGVDMPLKSQDEIHAFFSANAGKEFIGFSSYPGWQSEVERKMRWHLFPGQFQRVFSFTPVSILRSVFLKIQYIMHMRRNAGVEIRKGTQWISVTDSFVRYLISKQDEVHGLFTHTFCCDEMFAQTMCWNSHFKDSIYCLDDEENGCQRTIGWKDGVLYPWSMADYGFLLSSGKIFARKFTSEHIDVVDKLLEHVTG